MNHDDYSQKPPPLSDLPSVSYIGAVDEVIPGKSLNAVSRDILNDLIERMYGEVASSVNYPYNIKLTLEVTE